ncbi:hypothetical protein [Pseudoalteromonas piratica]|uniref:Porin n=1 Tax=Pseudoalteromonas piratica TaxID=1348114 RepID=A0A0A7EEA9_9GAMM|nr:hypothetical protein [Pseudoalteromonas piratica]AIY64401.1 hypothetical protein OM33_03990 [Pseudoalteromonas piratica]
MKILLPFALLFASNAALANDSIQHQIDFGVSDLYDFDDHFVGLAYTYLFEDIANVRGPHNLKAYINRIDSLTTRALVLDEFYDIDVGYTHYFDNNLVFRGEVEYARDNHFDDHYVRVAGELGNHITPNLQLGVGATYLYRNETDYIGNQDSSNNWRLSPYIRYTKIMNGQGWDFVFKQISGKESYYQGRADYYLSENWYVGIQAVAQTNDFDNNNTELQTQYWFNPHLSFSFGLGAGLGNNDSGFNSVTLLVTSRF